MLTLAIELDPTAIGGLSPTFVQPFLENLVAWDVRAWDV